MTVLVTGATGLVGARLLPRLLEAGMDCRALTRRGKQAPAGVTAVEGDLFDPASLVQAVEGVSAIIHLAAVFRTSDDDLIWKSNLEGARSPVTVFWEWLPIDLSAGARRNRPIDADSR